MIAEGTTMTYRVWLPAGCVVSYAVRGDSDAIDLDLDVVDPDGDIIVADYDPDAIPEVTFRTYRIRLLPHPRAGGGLLPRSRRALHLASLLMNQNQQASTARCITEAPVEDAAGGELYRPAAKWRSPTKHNNGVTKNKEPRTRPTLIEFPSSILHHYPPSQS